MSSSPRSPNPIASPLKSIPDSIEMQRAVEDYNRDNPQDPIPPPVVTERWRGAPKPEQFPLESPASREEQNAGSRFATWIPVPLVTAQDWNEYFQYRFIDCVPATEQHIRMLAKASVDRKLTYYAFLAERRSCTPSLGGVTKTVWYDALTITLTEEQQWWMEHGHKLDAQAQSSLDAVCRQIKEIDPDYQGRMKLDDIIATGISDPNVKKLAMCFQGMLNYNDNKWKRDRMERDSVRVSTVKSNACIMGGCLIVMGIFLFYLQYVTKSAMVDKLLQEQRQEMEYQQRRSGS